jgi:DNA gyrase subunit A
MARFKLSDLQAQAILDMQLRRLAALERQKIEDEHRDLLATIAGLEDLLASPKKILALIQTELHTMAEKYGDDRRTQIAVEAKEELADEDLVENKPVLVSITQRGYIKRTLQEKYRAQTRGSVGAKGAELREEDAVQFLFLVHSLDTLLFFSDKGKVYSEKVYQIPDADRAARGIPLVNVLSLEPGEIVTAALSVPTFEAAEYVTLATRNGRMKRLALADLSAVRPSGILAIGLEAGDELGWARLTHGGDEIILVTEQGQALRIAEKVIRPMGRTAAGVSGIRLVGDDKVASMEVVEPQGQLVLVTTQGFGKRTPLDEYPLKGRGTGGVHTISKDSIAKIGIISAARVVQESDDLTLISANGMVLRMKVREVKEAGRATRGVRLMEVREDDKVASLARIAAAELKKAGAVTNGEPLPEAGQQIKLPIK